MAYAVRRDDESCCKWGGDMHACSRTDALADAIIQGELLPRHRNFLQ
jgi:hypothetical protein